VLTGLIVVALVFILLVMGNVVRQVIQSLKNKKKKK
jgi:hypothetical protein